MTKEQKNENRNEYIKIVVNSWTYEKLTQTEKINIIAILLNCKLYGRNKKEVCEQLNTIYRSFLMALNYTPLNWRETDPEQKPIF